VKDEGYDPSGSGLVEVDWETIGQRMVRNEVAVIAERWHWSPDVILRMAVRTRRSYWHRVIDFIEQEKHASKSKG